jgi:exosortase
MNCHSLASPEGKATPQTVLRPEARGLLSEDSGTSKRNPNTSLRITVFAALFGGSVVFSRHVLMSTVQLAAGYDEYTHILLILPIAVVFIYIKRKLLRTHADTSVGYGLVVLCVAGLIATGSRLRTTWMTGDLQLSIEMIALVTSWIGSFLLCFGTRVFRSLLFPLCFLFGMVPLPAFALDLMIKYLQQGSMVAARLLFTAAGIPVVQNGLMLTIPGLTLEIAKECSSIRSSMLLLLTALVLAQVFLRSNLRKLLVVAIAVPLSVAKNGLRIFAIAMLGTRVDAGFLTGRLHRQGGAVFYVAALLVVFLLLRILELGEKRREQTRP